MQGKRAVKEFALFASTPRRAAGPRASNGLPAPPPRARPDLPQYIRAMLLSRPGPDAPCAPPSPAGGERAVVVVVLPAAAAAAAGSSGGEDGALPPGLEEGLVGVPCARVVYVRAGTAGGRTAARGRWARTTAAEAGEAGEVEAGAGEAAGEAGEAGEAAGEAGEAREAVEAAELLLLSEADVVIAERASALTLAAQARGP
jgi:hypothetical protein